ncbi:MAG: hypothetical protein FWG65_02160 [Turicibacter sp.]|nr:hypothetical protein [Turicibacter sp.]
MDNVLLAEHKRQLFQLLLLEDDPEMVGLFITQLTAVMDEEDVKNVRIQAEEYFLIK